MHLNLCFLNADLYQNQSQSVLIYPKCHLILFYGLPVFMDRKNLQLYFLEFYIFISFSRFLTNVVRFVMETLLFTY